MAIQPRRPVGPHRGDWGLARGHVTGDPGDEPTRGPGRFLAALALYAAGNVIWWTLGPPWARFRRDRWRSLRRNRPTFDFCWEFLK